MLEIISEKFSGVVEQAIGMFEISPNFATIQNSVVLNGEVKTCQCITRM